jgi:hypothetical protein
MLAAIGFPLLVVGFVMCRFFGASTLEAMRGKMTTSDKVGASMIILGAILLLVSVSIWLAGVMP